MNPKEYLKQLKLLDIKIKQKKTQVKELEEMRGNIQSVDYSKDRVRTSVQGNQVEKNAIKLVMLEVDIQNDIINYAEKKEEIVKAIHNINEPTHIVLLFKKYVEFKKLEVVAVEMGYDYDYIRRLHGKALQDFKRSHTKSHSDVI